MGDGGRQMCLAAAVATREHDPAHRVTRIGARRVVGLARARYGGVEGREGLLGEGLQAKKAVELAAPLLFELVLFADAGHRLTKEGIVGIQLLAQIAGAAADRAGIRRGSHRGGQRRARASLASWA